MKLRFVSGEDFYKTYDCLTDKEKTEAQSFTDSDFDFGEYEVLFAYSSGCIVLRYYSENSGYHFDAPFAITENADMEKVFFDISEYCKLECIPEVVVGIEPEFKNAMLRGAKNYYETQDEDGTYAIQINTECMTAEYLPEVMIDDVYLGEFAYRYADEYEKLNKDENLNLHFGYNILDDVPNGDGKEFIDFVKAEFERGESMTFAATVLREGENIFVGEGCLYAFDGRGAASVSFRVLRKWQRRGIGRKIFRALMKMAKEIGLLSVTAEVKKENIPSVILLDTFNAEKSETDDKFTYIFDVLEFKGE